MIRQNGWHEHHRRNPLHSNLLVSSLQVLKWAMFQPSKWRAFIADIDPGLRPDCTFVDLRRDLWHTPQLRQLIAGYVVYTPAILLFSELILTFFGLPQGEFIAGMLAALAIMLFYLVLCGTWISIAVALALSVPGSLCFVLGYALVGGLGYPLAIPEAYTPLYGVVYGLTIGLGGGLAGLVADNLVSGSAEELPSRFGIKLGGAAIGVLLSGLINFAMHSLMRFALWMTFGYEAPGGNAQDLWVASLLLIPALLIFIALVGVRRSWEVLRVTGIVLLCILGMFVLFAQTDFLRGTTIGFTVTFIALMGIPYTVVERIAGPRVAAVATALGLGIGWNVWQTTAYPWSPWPQIPITLAALIVGTALPWWGPVLIHPLLELWNLVIIRMDERRPPDRPSLLHWHTAFWFDAHRLPLQTLDDYLVTIAERRPTVSQAVLEELSNSRHQRWAVQAAQIELYARQLERLTDVESIASAAPGLASGELESPVSGLLRSFSRIGQSVQAALSGASIYHKRLALSAVEERLDALSREMTLSTDPYTFRFRPIAIRWRKIIADSITSLAAAAVSTQEIENPYIFSLPLTEYQELFVGRTDIAARIEQLLVDRRRPPLLLYGQRRMGKTSLLRNLSRLLPSTTVLLFIDGEGISGAADYHDLLYAIAAAMVRSAEHHRHLSLPLLDRAVLVRSPFTIFNEWLDQVERALEEAQSVALLALDEFEALGNLSGKGRFDETDLLRLLRNLIQHRPRFKVLLAGSHTLEEFRPWASQLINVQVVKISYLEEADVLALIDRPMGDFPLRYDPTARCKVLELTHGHPHLVQLLCYEIVELKNRHAPEQRLLVTADDVEVAVEAALKTGDFFFADLSNQAGPTGNQILRLVADAGAGAITRRAALEAQGFADLDRALTVLFRRDLIEEVDGGYRFQVELIRRWFGLSANVAS